MGNADKNPTENVMAERDERTIAEMRNLGPACQADLNAVGLLVAQDVLDLGVEATFLQMLEGRRAKGRSAKCCNAAYLYAIYGAIHDVDWRNVPEETKTQYKQLTAELRASGRFAR